MMPDVWEYSKNEAATASRKFRWRTALFPLLFMILHWLVINLVGTAYLFLQLFWQGASFQDETMLNQILVEQYPIIAILYSLILIPIYLVFLLISRRRDPRILATQPLKMYHLLPSIAIMIGALGVTNLWFNLLLYLSDQSEWLLQLMQDYQELSEAFAPTAGYVWLILGIVVLAPVSEELLFRGIVQGELRKAMPEGLAVIVQGLLFALFHLQIVQVSYVILPGILLGLAYAWSKNLWVPIIMHIVFNFMGSVLPAWADGDEVLGTIIFYAQIAFIAVGALAMIYFYLRRYPSVRAGARLRTAKSGE